MSGAGCAELILLEDQVRSLWDAAQIEAGRAALDRALGLGGRGPYVLQAAIASLQTEEQIDWPQVAARCTASSPGSHAHRWSS